MVHGQQHSTLCKVLDAALQCSVTAAVLYNSPVVQDLQLSREYPLYQVPLADPIGNTPYTSVGKFRLHQDVLEV